MISSPNDENWHRTETFKSLVPISVEALKVLVLINGGAAVSVLTYLGNIATKGEVAIRLSSMRLPLVLYGAGVTAAALAFIAAYFVQLRLYQESTHPEEKKKRHHLIVGAGGLLALASPVLFALGCWFAAEALTRHG